MGEIGDFWGLKETKRTAKKQDSTNYQDQNASTREDLHRQFENELNSHPNNGNNKYPNQDRCNIWHINLRS
jgi:hypothetical protein